MRSADRDSARLAKGPHRRARHYADNAGFEPGFGVAGLKGARPRAALTLREDGLPIPMSRAGNGIQRIGPMAIPGAACLGGGQAKGARGGRGRRARAHADRRARTLPAPAAPGAHAARARPPCKEVGDPGGVQHALALLCVARGDWARQAPAKGRLADRGLQDIHQAHRGGRPALTGRALARQARRAWWPRLDRVSSRWIAGGLFARLAVLVGGPGDQGMPPWPRPAPWGYRLTGPRLPLCRARTSLACPARSTCTATLGCPSAWPGTRTRATMTGPTPG